MIRALPDTVTEVGAEASQRRLERLNGRMGDRAHARDGWAVPDEPTPEAAS